MSRVVLLGPQRFDPTVRDVVRSLGVEGPIATVVAGWQEREADDAELDALLDGRSVNLDLHARWLDVQERDGGFAAADQARRDLLDELAAVYLLRLRHAMAAVHDLQRRDGDPRVSQDALDAALAAVRELDAGHLRRCAQVHDAFYAAWAPHERPVVAAHRAAVAERLAGAGALAIGGGHVGVLLACLHLFNVGAPARGVPVVAWSAGAMAVTETVVLFHDRVVHGSGGAEVFDAGLALVRGVVALPHARRRLRLGDRRRMALLAGRFAPADCLLLDDGARVDIVDGAYATPAAAVLGEDGAVVPVPPEGAGGLISSAQPSLAIDQLVRRGALEPDDIDAFLKRHDVPLIEGLRCTFLYRGEADAVAVTHRVLGLDPRLPLRRIDGTDLWYAVIELPEESRVEYRLAVTRHGATEEQNDPLNPRLAHSPFGASSAVYGAGYEVPEWTRPDPEAREGTLQDLVVRSAALGRDYPVTLYLPARFRRSARYPLLVVHDGADYLAYASAKTVLDNLIHRLDLPELVAAFTHPADRLVEYPDHPGHARFIAVELLGELETSLPLLARPRGRVLMGSSFGGVATLSTAVRHPRVFGGLLVQSGSFLFTDIGADHRGGPVFDPVVEFMNAYRARPRRCADRLHVSCGTYEPLIVPNRAMVPVFRATGMEVRYVEARDGHNWENWRDRLRDGLTWLLPGPQKYVYE